ncbi:EAL domain-containing protein [Erythrobacteraceae bacterium CFH 75059]|uniref:putative bifunctional diguanylate cyclase/phosphodiesterase n=1 Tax=Qipengyuania thermophila TaxID=2509361 RepID=UPI00101E936D|nr:EAL domain-containing protein [Qipengyuania thermophila]TCD06498.1 EAL domain-containing protein [Erythrobacteraceae bacterium CFH 75059]
MRVLSCVTQDHVVWLVVLAAAMCLAGACVASRLFHRCVTAPRATRLYWCLLAALTAGAATWATHFVAMLGHRANVPVTFDGPLTIFSALIAVAGIGAGLLLATSRRPAVAVVGGGSIIGLAIAAMHYVGMFAYRVEGVVTWLPGHVAASIILCVALCVAALGRLTGGRGATRQAALLLAAAILVLHFTGMAAFTVQPIPGVSALVDRDAFAAMAAAIALVALLIVGVGLSTYVVERKAVSHSQARLHHIAMHDELTAVANRRAFTEALEQECRRMRAFARPFALLLIDLDRFKAVNDTLGHPVGDKVLRRVAQRLRKAIRDGDLIARLGGDEFAVIAPNVADAAAARALADRIVEIMARPFLVDGHIADIGASVGVCLAPLHGSDPSALVQKADVALYTAKSEGKGRFCVFEPAMSEALNRRRMIEADLRRACMREEFDVVYQPITDTRTGSVTGAEALLRWTCAQRGEVSPAEFIPIAEDLGLVTRIGAGVLKQACRDAAGWPSHVNLSVNISPVQLFDPRLPSLVTQALEEAGLAPSRLELEITETALLEDDDVVMATLTRLRELGVRISLDDFGTGYSSLSYLHRYPISRIKIDRSFVRRLPDDASSASIVRAIVQLGVTLDLKITAEGIETDEQLAFMAGQGCHNSQGFLISRPVSSSALAAMARQAVGAAA